MECPDFIGYLELHVVGVNACNFRGFPIDCFVSHGKYRSLTEYSSTLASLLRRDVVRGQPKHRPVLLLLLSFHAVSNVTAAQDALGVEVKY